MGSTREMTVTLPVDIARLVDEKVASGEYTSESAVIQEGLALLLGQDPEFEAWLGTEGAAAYDAIAADPSRAVSIEEVRAHLAAVHAATTAGR